MVKRKKLLAICCSLILAVGVIALFIPHSAHGQATIPTRTPKPEPTDDDGGGSGGGGGGGSKPNPPDEQSPTAEPTQGSTQPTAVQATVVQATAAPTLIIPTATLLPAISVTPSAITETPFSTVPPNEGSPTPSGTLSASSNTEAIQIESEIIAFPENNEPFPEANPCGLPPTYTAKEAISVFAGPGIDYPLAGLLDVEGVRPIVGRAAFVNWWLVQLDESGRAGWVSDDLGTVHGYIERVPIINAPDLNGVAPTPGSTLWSPTPPTVCDAPELVIGAAINDQASNSNLVPPSGKPDSLKNLYDNMAVEEAASAETVIGSQAEQETISGDKSENMLLELAESAQPFALTSGSASGQQLPNLMPIAGLVLILAAVIVGLFARRGRTPGD
jgi:hypothetical protein